MEKSQQTDFLERFTLSIKEFQSALPFGVGEATYAYFDNLLKQIHDPNKMVVLANISISPEICNAMDIVPIQQEIVTALCAMLGTSTSYLDSAIESGLPQGDLCNFQKVWIGAMLTNRFPRPDLLLYAPEPCDSMHSNYQVIQNLYKIPAFGFDIPYWTYNQRSPYYSDKISNYMGKQIKKMVKFLEKHTNSKLQPEKLKEAINKSNIAREHVLDILEMCKAVPSPVPSSVLTPSIILLFCLFGTDYGIKLAKGLRDEVYNRVKNKQGHIELTYKRKTEKLRIMWILVPIFFDMNLDAWLERKYGCIAIFDILSTYSTPPIDSTSIESIYKGLGQAVLDIPMARQYRGPIEFFIDDTVRVCKDYKIDAVILGGHNCKNVFAVRKLISETLYKELGVKTLELEADSIDPRVMSKQNIKRNLSQFIEGLIENKSGLKK